MGLIADEKRARQERLLVAIRRNDGNVSLAASELGIARGTAYYWLRELGGPAALRHRWWEYAATETASMATDPDTHHPFSLATVQELHTHDSDVSVLSVHNQTGKPDELENRDTNVIADDLDFG